MNYRHKWHLVEAEKARVLGQPDTARTHYEQAIELAIEHQHVNDEALALEFAARFYEAQGLTRMARYYLRDAHYAYQRWGATAKVNFLEGKYPQLLLQRQTSSGTTVMGTTIRGRTTTTTDSRRGSSLDLGTILKASQTLSGTIKLDHLLTHLMRLVIENAGAELGYLILPSDDAQWVIEAEGRVNTEAVRVLQAQPLTPAVLPQAIINYVIRTQEHVVLNDATRAERYDQDAYIQAQQPKSVLCLPLLNQGKLDGLIYLENNLTTGAFTPDRIEVLNMLSGQAAISLENARLYDTLEQRVKQRTQELSDTLDDLRATQNQLIESEKMASLGSLVAGVAHEINTPVGVSVTAASTLSENTHEVSDLYAGGKLKGSALKAFFENSNRLTDLLLSNLNRAGELVQSFKQVAVDQTNLDLREITLKGYLESTLVSLRPQLQHTPHQFTITGDEDLAITTYPGAVSQLLTNLIMNSVTHAYPTGQAGQIGISVTPSEAGVTLVYQDDGVGILTENLAKIFEPFFTTKRGQGAQGWVYTSFTIWSLRK